MKFGTDYCMRQIKIPSETYLYIKHYCKNRKIPLLSFYEMMLDWFINEHKNQSALIFQASTKHRRTLSLWIRRRQIDIISTMASNAKVSDARVIYTALMLYLENIPEFTA